MSKLEDIGFRLEWFKHHSQELGITRDQLRKLISDVTVLTMDSLVAGADPGLQPFVDKYKTVHGDLSSDKYPQGFVAVAATSEFLYEAGRTYAQAEGNAHGLANEVAKMLETY